MKKCTILKCYAMEEELWLFAEFHGFIELNGIPEVIIKRATGAMQTWALDHVEESSLEEKILILHGIDLSGIAGIQFYTLKKSIITHPSTFRKRTVASSNHNWLWLTFANTEAGELPEIAKELKKMPNFVTEESSNYYSKEAKTLIFKPLQEQRALSLRS